jgi:small GTP-binding protein
MRVTDRSLARVIFIGDSGVGKTSLITRATTGTFGSPPPPTVCAGLRPITLKTKGQTYKVHLWDTAGQEVYRSIVPLYFKQATCALLVFSVAEPASFQELENWFQLLYSHTDGNVPALVVGNKIDIPNSGVAKEEVSSWAGSHKVPVFYTSAATGAGLDELLEYVATQVAPRAVPNQDIQTKAEYQCC